MKQRILAVDDEVHMLKLLERIVIEKTPYQIRVTNNALEAMEMLASERFDLVITDLVMPAMDGMDLLRKIKDRGQGEEVIMITAFGSMETCGEAHSLGVFDYINKPFKKERLIHSVDRAMRAQRMKKECERSAKMYRIEPFSEAEQAFRKEYIKRLSERYGGDISAMAENSGLDAGLIKKALTE